jgi:leucyl-tRNA synthetase
LVTLLSPYAPHLAEELWKVLGGEGLVIDSVWPKAEKLYLVEDEVNYPVSFNGKVRFKLLLPASTDIEEVKSIVVADERTLKQLDGKEIRKVIVVKGRIVNIVS